MGGVGEEEREGDEQIKGELVQEETQILIFSFLPSHPEMNHRYLLKVVFRTSEKGYVKKQQVWQPDRG